MSGEDVTVGSGSESGTQTQKSIRSKSAEKSDNNSGSNDEDDNFSPALNFVDGSDHGSGTQSSWTKQVVEDQVDSPRLLSNLNEVPECPDSTCVQFTFMNATPSESKLLPMTAAKECNEHNEPPENTELENVLKNLDHQPKFSVQIPSELTSVNQHTAPKIDCSNYGGRTENNMRDFQEKEELTMPGIAINFSKKPEITDNETDESRVFPSTEKGLKRIRGGQDVEKAVHDERNVLSRSESSVFSRYNALTHNKIVDSPSTTPSKTDTEKKSELRINIQSHSGSNVMNPCSDGVDLISSSDNKVTDTMASKNKTVEHSSIKKYSSPSGFRITEINRESSSKQVMLEGVTPVEMVVPLMCSTQEHQVHPENCHHNLSNHDDLLLKKLSKPIPLWFIYYFGWTP